MLSDSTKLKFALTLQGFCPLFVLIFLRYLNRFHLIIKLARQLFHGEFGAILVGIRHPEAGGSFLIVFSLVWCLVTTLFTLIFPTLWKADFSSKGEIIDIVQEKKDCGIIFLTTFLIPLLADDVSSWGDLFYFSGLLLIMIALLYKTELYCQNPVLALFNYRIYEFKVQQPWEDLSADTTYIGIAKTGRIANHIAFKRKHVAGNVYLVEKE